MAKILVCNPEFYGIEYEINPWMSIGRQADRNLAVKQWHNLVVIMQDIGVKIFEMSGKKNLPDIVFTANAAAILDGIAFLSNFKHPERQPEKDIYKEWFNEYNIPVIELPDNIKFEGAGDCLPSCDGAYAFFGYGFRSDKNVHIHKYWRALELKLVDPYFYHLDTCFCPLERNFALIYLPAIENYLELEEKTGPALKLLPVPKEEAAKFACNAVNIGNNVIIPSGCPETRKMLESVGFKVFDTDMSEFIKAGGACKCLTLRLD